MAKYINISNDVTFGNVKGDIIELDNGHLIGHLYDPTTTHYIAKSIDAGATWTTKYIHSGEFALNLRYVDSRGYIYFGINALHSFGSEPSPQTLGYILRSVDSGESWTEVLVGEATGFWRMAEDTTGNLYTNEYSSGEADADELYAYNIWKSTDGGANWTKWFVHPESPNTGPLYRNSIRHIHTVFVDSQDNFYASFGEDSDTFGTSWADGGKTYRLTSNGQLGSLISTEGNGWICWHETDSGKILAGSDQEPSGVYLYDPDTNTYTQVLNTLSEFGLISAYIWDIKQGRDGVIYALCQKYKTVFLSIDDGVNWIRADYETSPGTSADRTTSLSVNRNTDSNVLYINRAGTYVVIKDYTKAEIQALYTSSLTVRLS